MYANTVEAHYVVDEGLVSYWDFDHIAGKTVEDRWGNNDGTMVGNPQKVEGKIGNALEFDGDNYVDCGNDASLNFSSTNSWTISAWINTVTTSDEGVFSRIDAAQDYKGYELMIVANGQIATGLINAWSSSNSLWVDTVGTGWADENWHHIASTYDGSENVDGMKIYVDGNSEALDIIQNGFTSGNSIDPNKNAKIGARINGAGITNEFNGTIDEVAIYNRALSEDEVEQNFTALDGFAVESTKKLALTWGEIKVSR